MRGLLCTRSWDTKIDEMRSRPWFTNRRRLWNRHRFWRRRLCRQDDGFCALTLCRVGQAKELPETTHALPSQIQAVKQVVQVCRSRWLWRSVRWGLDGRGIGLKPFFAVEGPLFHRPTGRKT